MPWSNAFKPRLNSVADRAFSPSIKEGRDQQNPVRFLLTVVGKSGETWGYVAG